MLLDLTQLLDTADGDWEMVEEILTLYFDDAPRHLEKLRVDLKAANAPAVRDSAHILKGASGAFGKNEMHQQAMELENKALAGDLSDAEGRLASLESTLSEMKIEADRMLKSRGV